MDESTQQLVRGSLRSMFADGSGDLVSELDALGWADVLADPADAADAQALLAYEHAGALSDAPVYDSIAAAALGLPGDTRFVWPYFDRPSHGLVGTCSGQLEVIGLVLGGAIPDEALLPVAGRVHPVRVADLEVAPIAGIDDSARWQVARGSVRIGSPRGNWAAAETAVTLALAVQLTALAERALQVACGHVRTRHQFGQAIGSYQSVRHRLAGAYASLTGALSLTRAAGVDGGAEAARLAKAAAGRAHADVAREAVQVCGGIGLSAEFPLAGFVKRGFLLDEFFNPGRAIVRASGAALLDGRRLDPITRF